MSHAARQMTQVRSVYLLGSHGLPKPDQGLNALAPGTLKRGKMGGINRTRRDAGQYLRPIVRQASSQGSQASHLIGCPRATTRQAQGLSFAADGNIQGTVVRCIGYCCGFFVHHKRIPAYFGNRKKPARCQSRQRTC